MGGVGRKPDPLPGSPAAGSEPEPSCCPLNTDNDYNTHNFAERVTFASKSPQLIRSFELRLALWLLGVGRKCRPRPCRESVEQLRPSANILDHGFQAHRVRPSAILNNCQISADLKGRYFCRVDLL